MRKQRKIIYLVIVVAMVLVMMAACTTKEPAESDTQNDIQNDEAASNEADVAEKPAEKVYFGVAVRYLGDSYYAAAQKGVDAFSAWLTSEGVDHEIEYLVSDFSDEQELTQIKAFVAAHGENCVLFVDPNNAPNAAPIADVCEEAKVYFETVWSTSEDIRIKDYNYYVCHQTLNDQSAGYMIAKEMFESFDTPGEGKILVIQGMLANSAAINRGLGLDKALGEYPNIEVLDLQAADWDNQKAYDIAETWLAKYDDIDGIWVANDGMALRVVELLKAKGLNGQIKVVCVDGTPEGVQAVKDGDILATVYANPGAQYGIGLSILYGAYTGQFVPAELPAGQRCFLTASLMINSDSVDSFLSEDPVFDFENYWDLASEPYDISLIEGY